MPNAPAKHPYFKEKTSFKPQLNATDKLMYLVAFVYPITTLPQIVHIFVRKTAGDLSLISWGLFAACNVVSLAYAVRRRITPLIIEDCLWLGMYGFVIVGILLYHK